MDPATHHGQMRVDELARAAGVATTTVRLYQTKGLLPGPEVVGRTGYYGQAHLDRLELIARLQADGFSLAGIARLLEVWEAGRGLGDLVGGERVITTLLNPGSGVVLTPEELLERFPADAFDGAAVQRAATLGLIEATDDGRLGVPDERFLDTGAALARLGVPAEAILDEWEQLAATTDVIAARFIDLFESHLLAPDWASRLDAERLDELATTLGELRRIAEQVVVTALDRSISQLGRQRLVELYPDDEDGRSAK